MSHVRMSSAVQAELRRRYRETWGSDWPQDNAFLTVLWFETKRDLGVSERSKLNGPKIKAMTLELMKENT